MTYKEGTGTEIQVPKNWDMVVGSVTAQSPVMYRSVVFFSHLPLSALSFPGRKKLGTRFKICSPQFVFHYFKIA
jgi:hypothetical protein